MNNEVDTMEKQKQISRKQMREEIIKKLYEIDINNGDISLSFEEDYIQESVNGVLAYQTKIDEIIVRNLKNYTLKRLSYVDRAIIRFATYELYYTNVPAEIIINEALNITRKFTDEGNNKMVGFTNKVLDNIKNDLKK
jgi:N utilization substance protein B